MMAAARDGHHSAGPMPPAIAAAALVLASFAVQHLGAAANSSPLAQAAEIFAKKAKSKLSNAIWQCFLHLPTQV